MKKVSLFWNTEGFLKPLRYGIYRHLPLSCAVFYRCRRKAWDREAMVRHDFEPFPAQQEFLRVWIIEPSGYFWEWDAGDGVVGSHARLLEERRGWRGICVETRRGAAAHLAANRSAAKVFTGADLLEAQKLGPSAGPDLLTSRRPESQGLLLQAMEKWLRPRYLVWQARNPDPDTWRRLLRLGYRLENFIHDDEYYRRAE